MHLRAPNDVHHGPGVRKTTSTVPHTRNGVLESEDVLNTREMTRHDDDDRDHGVGVALL